MKAFALALLAAVGCKAKPAQRDDAAVAPPPRDASPAVDAGVWPELATLPSVTPERVIAIPTKTSVPRFTVAGPILVGDLAIVASSQFGFAAVDFRRGQLAWTKAAGSHIAPPVILDGNVILVGDCVAPPTIPEDETLLGCMRVVSPAGADQAYIAIRGRKVSAFAASAGDQRVWTDSGAIVWKRGDAAVSIDAVTGVAAPAADTEPPLVVTHGSRRWDIRRTDDGVITATGSTTWKTERSFGPLLGAVYIPEQSPMVRVVIPQRHAGKPELLLSDMDATGSLHGQVSLHPVPGIGLVGHAISKVGNTALAVRLDTSLERDYIAGFAANASLQWTYPLPQMLRPDPVGIAIAHDAVVVFHDGDTLTILPELSAPPTAPGAARDPSENATP